MPGVNQSKMRQIEGGLCCKCASVGINAVHELRSMPNDLNLRQFIRPYSIRQQSQENRFIDWPGGRRGGSLRDNFESIRTHLWI